MNPLLKAQIGSTVRWISAILGASGVVELNNEQVEALIEITMVVAPLIWSWIEKILARRTLQAAQDAATFRTHAGTV